MANPNDVNAKTNTRLNKPFCRSLLETSTFFIEMFDFDELENKKVKYFPLFVIML